MLNVLYEVYEVFYHYALYKIDICLYTFVQYQ